jgi:hypothetical protein
MNHVTSRDGTSIAYDRQGIGPPVILVGGGLDDGSENAPLAAEPATSFTVYNYARRQRRHPAVRAGARDRGHRSAGRRGRGAGASVWRLVRRRARPGDAIAASVPNAERLVVARQSHVADPAVVAPVLERFLSR